MPILKNQRSHSSPLCFTFLNKCPFVQGPCTVLHTFPTDLEYHFHIHEMFIFIFLFHYYFYFHQLFIPATLLLLKLNNIFNYHIRQFLFNDFIFPKPYTLTESSICEFTFMDINSYMCDFIILWVNFGRNACKFVILKF